MGKTKINLSVIAYQTLDTVNSTKESKMLLKHIANRKLSFIDLDDAIKRCKEKAKQFITIVNITDFKNEKQEDIDSLKSPFTINNQNI